MLIIIFCLFANNIFANQHHTNRYKTDSVLIDSLTKVAGNYRFSNPDTAVKILDSAINIAVQGKMYKQMLVAMRTKGVFYIISSKYDSAIAVYSRAIPLAEKYNQIPILSRIYINLGIVYTQMGDFNKAQLYYDKVIEDYGDQLDLKTKATIYNNLGLMYSAKGDYLKSMKSHQNALAIREESGDSLGLASSILNIANIHFYQEKYKVAIQEYLQASEVFSRYNYKYGMRQCSHNIGTIYEKIDSLVLAEKYLKESLKYESARMSSGKAKTLNMLGLVSMKEGKYEQAKQYFLESLEINKKINSNTKIIPTLNNLADLYNIMGQPDKSLYYSKTALSLSKKSGSKTNLKDAYYNYSKSYEQLSNYKMALYYYKEYNLLKDSIFGIEKHKQLQELEVKYQTSEKEKELNLKKAEIIQKDLEAKKKDAIIRTEQVQKYSLTLVTLLSLIIFFILYRNQQNKRKSALLLIDKNEELNNQKISDLIKKHQLDSVKGRLQAEENERQRIAQELHDGIGGSLAAIKLYIDSLRKTSGMEELDLVYENINTTYEQVRALSHNLTPPEFKFSSINDIVKDYVSQISQHSTTEIVLNSKVSTGWSNLDETVQIGIFRITQELLNNVIKHARANRVVFDLNLDEKDVIIIVTDDGVGFDTSKKMNGIGIRNIKLRVEDLKGSIKINSELGVGTKIELQIPIK
jgi:signal transduction histidine kinase/Flp pilus assembly protein TadD